MATLSFDNGDDEGSEVASDIQTGGVILLPDSDAEMSDEDGDAEKTEDGTNSKDTKKRKRKGKEEKKEKKKKKKKKRVPAPVPLPLMRHKIRLRNEFKVDQLSNLEVREFECMDVDGAILVEGFPCKGLSSVMAANFLIKSLDLPLVGEVFCRAFPTVGRVSNYQPSHPIRIYGDKSVVVFVSEVELDDAQVCWTMAQAMFDFGNRHRCPLLVTFESLRKILEIDLESSDLNQDKILEMISARMTGRTQEEKEEAAKNVFEAAEKACSPKAPRSAIVNSPRAKKQKTSPCSSTSTGSKNKEKEGEANKDEKKETDEADDDKDEILFFTNDPEIAVRARAAGGVPTKNVIVGGVSGCIVAESHTQEMPVICVISHHSALESDHHAALHCLTFAEKLAGGKLKIDVDPLKKKAASQEKQLKRALSEMAHGVKRKSKVSESMYM